MEMEYPHSGIRIDSTLTEQEKWYFDLHGFLVLRQAVPPENLKELQRSMSQLLSYCLSHQMYIHRYSFLHQKLFQ